MFVATGYVWPPPILKCQILADMGHIRLVHKKGGETGNRRELSTRRGNVRLKRPDFLNFTIQEVVATLEQIKLPFLTRL